MIPNDMTSFDVETKWQLAFVSKAAVKSIHPAMSSHFSFPVFPFSL
jgi:hypothetical protein